MEANKPKSVGRPKVADKDRKQSFTVSISMARAKVLIKKYKSLTKALESIVV